MLLLISSGGNSNSCVGAACSDGKLRGNPCDIVRACFQLLEQAEKLQGLKHNARPITPRLWSEKYTLHGAFGSIGTFSVCSDCSLRTKPCILFCNRLQLQATVHA